ncbi:helix-turn-helix domain-containing protein [Candidatus Woesearchaeota archaeon]|jgi:KaiC/GvpD/RAD55 family RecA-like ATPase|nr:helix-turn-helix domain-containing protein [Candidatus Woesearchaeota archaeon]MBT5740055.1 helix-turn-helix domain-containing protein [Candidatus Woesearchaeota archaeon]
MEKKDKKKITIIDLLQSHPDGLTIQDIMNKTGLARHTVLARLHALVGSEKVDVKQINMAKVHKWKQEEPTKEDIALQSLQELLKSHPEGLSISEMIEKTGLTKSTISDQLHSLTNSGKVNVKKVNQDNVHTLKDEPSPKEDVKLQPLQEEHITKLPRKSKAEKESESKSTKPQFDIEEAKDKIQAELKSGKIKRHHAKIKEERAPVAHVAKTVNGNKKIDMAAIKEEIEEELKGKKKPHKKLKKGEEQEYIYTGIEGFDALLDKGLPKGAAVLVAGGAGSGKTIFALQTLEYHASHGEKCLYMSFEESEERLIKHMEDFGWDPQKHIKDGNLLLKRFNPFEITRSVDALLMKSKGELLIDVQPIIFPGNFKPDIIVVDSLTAIASAFTGKEDSYRIYIEQLFRFFEEIGATSFLITETKQVPTIFSTTGVEEFLADAVVVIYNIKRGNVRERAIEVLKLRGAGHQHKIVAMNITSDGLDVFPDQEIFGGLDES